MPDANPRLLTVVAILLRQGNRLDQLSRLLTVAALIGLIAWHPGLPPRLAIAGSAAAGLVELWFATRAALDAALFQNQAGVENWDAMDAALVHLNLMSVAKTGRAVAERIAGALSLLRFQAAALILQLALGLLAAIL